MSTSNGDKLKDVLAVLMEEPKPAAEDWVDVEKVLNLFDERNHGHILKVAAKNARGGLDAAYYMAQCEEAKIEVMWPSMMGNASRLHKTLRYGMPWIPRWAAIVFCATTDRTSQQRRMLADNATNTEFQEAIVTVWRLGGVAAVEAWIKQEGHLTP